MKSRTIKMAVIMTIFEMIIILLSPKSMAKNESFTLTANKTSINVNETINVELNLSNGMQNQNQLTIIVKYDSEKLEIIPDTKDTDNSEILVENESLYNDIVSAGDGVILGFVNNDSTVSLVYYTNSGESYLKTSAKLAKLKFKAIKSGTAKISFDKIEYAYESDDPTEITSNNELTIQINGNTKKGDVNADNKINVLDCTAILKHIKGTKRLSAEEQTRADVNKDNKINVLDCTAVLKHIKGTKLIE